ncbi:3-phenylpropionate/trans-cinnamate dioxygenase ferredoxin reductase subunit [Rhodopseudomonas julia]|uniref:3-phenylpropionate/trans-cinnamate dioxygenase ferredoxin reductase subunit n=1 Tax=Rhodopseudomonas julia TaxID=200617 RepID=A0ABU0C6M4_9BRAD|nr:FAD-dependent oxidoreductase [Rhodopseudomonas julia]MDQ0326161.1 3-phenylpropionate/trans-cinnamate dioxygenase ferredoxin reductase subunit [Rhodopseudomonas julia]
MSEETQIIVGTGHAGVQLAASLRELGFTGRIVLIGEETDLPYQRPPLSKGYLIGSVSADGLLLRGEKFYEDRNIELILGEAVTTIDRAAREVELQSGRRLRYDHLTLALGVRNRPLPVPGAELDGVFAVRGLADSNRLRERMDAASDLVVVGGGFIGLELAAVAAKLGKNVTVVELAPRVMARVVTPKMSEFFENAHRRRGVHIITDARVQRLEGENDHVTSVVLADGRNIAADLVLYGIGVLANSELAEAAGLEVKDGIVVDEFLATSDPAISAIGDVANHPNVQAGTPMRLESVQNAVDQARCLAARLVGKPAAYCDVPWFWSDQANLKLQMVGLPFGTDQTILRGDPEAETFSVFCFKEGRLIAVESVNRPADHMAVRTLMKLGVEIRAHQVEDPDFDLRAFTQAQRKAAAQA